MKLFGMNFYYLLCQTSEDDLFQDNLLVMFLSLKEYSIANVKLHFSIHIDEPIMHLLGAPAFLDVSWFEGGGFHKSSGILG